MNKQLIGIVIAILLLIGGGLAYLMLQEDDNDPDTTSTNQTVDEESGGSTPSETSANTGQYIEEYDESQLATTENRKVLFFHAPWCPQCRALEADIKAKGVPAGVTIFKVDYDANQALRQKYEVAIQTTLVEVDSNGNMIKSYVAYDDPTLANVEENLLQ